jgi:hypothetical protein
MHINPRTTQYILPSGPVSPRCPRNCVPFLFLFLFPFHISTSQVCEKWHHYCSVMNIVGLAHSGAPAGLHNCIRVQHSRQMIFDSVGTSFTKVSFHLFSKAARWRQTGSIAPVPMQDYRCRNRAGRDRVSRARRYAVYMICRRTQRLEQEEKKRRRREHLEIEKADRAVGWMTASATSGAGV